jgi:hypothetical protein
VRYLLGRGSVWELQLTAGTLARSPQGPTDDALARPRTTHQFRQYRATLAQRHQMPMETNCSNTKAPRYGWEYCILEDLAVAVLAQAFPAPVQFVWRPDIRLRVQTSSSPPMSSIFLPTRRPDIAFRLIIYHNIRFYRIRQADGRTPRTRVRVTYWNRYQRRVRACRSLLFGLVLVLLLLAATAEAGLACVLAQVHDQPCPRLLLVPLESCEVGQVKLVIGLAPLSATDPYLAHDRDSPSS